MTLLSKMRDIQVQRDQVKSLPLGSHRVQDAACPECLK